MRLLIERSFHRLVNRIGRNTCLIPDRLYLSSTFYLTMGYKINWICPKSFNEKLQWLKIYDRNSDYTRMVDKYEAKQYVSDIIGSKYVIPTYGVWDNPYSINFDLLPNQFVMKTTHDSGHVIICKDKRTLDIELTRKQLSIWLRERFYCIGREWPYKNVKPRIIAEQMLNAPMDKGLINEQGTDLKDYKFFCFNGKVQCFKIDYDRFSDHHANYYNTEGMLLDFGEADFPPNLSHVEHIPDNLGEMIQLSERLSANTPFLRVDFYNISGKIFFGELTFFPASGWGKFTADDYDIMLGNYLALPSL